MWMACWQRWKREMPAHSDRAILLKMVCKTHLSSERGELTFQPPSTFVNMNVYTELFWDEKWKHQMLNVRKQLYRFVRIMTKCVDVQYDYTETELKFEFSAEVKLLLIDAITKMGYVSSHFLATRVFYKEVPDYFFKETVELYTPDLATITTSFASLPRYIFFILCEHLGCHVPFPVWQNKKHLFAEWCSIYFFFNIVWNEHDEMPLNKHQAFTKRWLLEVSDEALMTQLANRWNTNPTLYGNANTSELFHSYSNRNHVSKTNQGITNKENAMNLIAKK